MFKKSLKEEKLKKGNHGLLGGKLHR